MLTWCGRKQLGIAREAFLRACVECVQGTATAIEGQGGNDFNFISSETKRSRDTNISAEPKRKRRKVVALCTCIKDRQE